MRRIPSRASTLAPFVVPPDDQPIIDIRWGGIPVAPDWQVIGKWGQTIGNKAVQLYPGPQRRNGVGDISSIYNSGPVIPTFTAQVPLQTPGTQRFAKAPPRHGPSKYGKWQLAAMMNAQQLAQSGPQLPGFMNALNQSGSAAPWPNYPTGGQP